MDYLSSWLQDKITGCELKTTVMQLKQTAFEDDKILLSGKKSFIFGFLVLLY